LKDCGQTREYHTHGWDFPFRKHNKHIMNEVIANIGWSVIFALVGGVVGVSLVLGASMLLPKLIERMTPDLDEGKEIARGNVAVAQYFGRVVSASIIGISIVIAAAVLGGILAGLH
jgi:F0F1-type ATP synthase assembly protein I